MDLKTFGEFGVLSLMLGALFFGIGVAARWLCINAVKPLVTSFVFYLEEQTQTTKDNQASLMKLAALETDIRDTIREMHKEFSESNAIKLASVDEIHNALEATDSQFTTIRTNASIMLLAKAVQRVAAAVQVDIEDLVEEIQRTIEPK